MNTRWLMVASAAWMGILGAGVSFFPQEILAAVSIPVTATAVLLLQVTGALYLGFAVLNWMARGNLIGGIYSRPVALGNFLHFGIVALTLIKAILNGQREPALIAVAAIYLLLGFSFGTILFSSPVRATQQPPDNRD